VFDQNVIEIDQTPIRPMLFLAALGTLVPVVCQTVCFVSNCKND